MKQLSSMLLLVVMLTSCGAQVHQEVQNTNIPVSESVTDLGNIENGNQENALSAEKDKTQKNIVVVNHQTSARFDVLLAEPAFEKTFSSDAALKNLAAGMQLVRVKLLITGTSDGAFPFNYENFSLGLPGTGQIDPSEFPERSTTTDILPLEADLMNGQSVSGEIYFQVSNKLNIADLALYYESVDEEGVSKVYPMSLE